MTHIDSFGRSAAFAAVVALGWMPWLIVTGPFLGSVVARALYLIVATALYAGGLAASPPRRALVAMIVGGAGVVLAVLARGTPELCVALGVVLAVARSVFLHRTAPPRAVVLEVVLIGGGLAFARFLSGGALGTTVGLWGFFLWQSCFFLVGGVGARVSDGRHPDAFEEAVARATEVLGRPLA